MTNTKIVRFYTEIALALGEDLDFGNFLFASAFRGMFILYKGILL